MPKRAARAGQIALPTAFALCDRARAQRGGVRRCEPSRCAAMAKRERHTHRCGALSLPLDRARCAPEHGSAVSRPRTLPLKRRVSSHDIWHVVWLANAHSRGSVKLNEGAAAAEVAAQAGAIGATDLNAAAGPQGPNRRCAIGTAFGTRQRTPTVQAYHFAELSCRNALRCQGHLGTSIFCSALYLAHAEPAS